MGPVLVGVDGSADSAAALRWAAWFAATTGRDLHVAHAWQAGTPLEPLDEPEPDVIDVESFESRVRGRLDALTAEVLGDGRSVQAHLVLRGPAASALSKEAARHDGTVVVVGAQGAGGALRSLLGSTSRDLTECPSHAVVVVPPDLDPPHGAVTVMVAIDGSNDGARALRWAAATAVRSTARVVAVHAIEVPKDDLSADERAAVEREMRLRVDEEWCAPLRTRAVPYTTIVEIGRPELVVERAADATAPACVAVGSRGLGSLTQRLVGSVTHTLVRRLDWPTVVIPGPRDCIVWDPDRHG